MWIAALWIIFVAPYPTASLDEYCVTYQNCHWLQIIHQGDIHSHFEQVTSSNHVCPRNASATNTSCYGGFGRAVKYFKYLTQDKPYVLNLNTGDFFQGHIFYSYFGWEVVADIVSKMTYHALALGTQEFDDGLEPLLSFMRRIGPKFLCTNFDFSQLNETLRAEFTKLCPRHLVVTVRAPLRHGDITVALLGYTTPKTKFLLKPDENIIFEDEVKALSREVALIHNDTKYKRKRDVFGRGVKVFVALGHAGIKRDRQIAHAVPSLDVIVGGHSHTLAWPGVWQPFEPTTPDDSADTAHDVYPVIVTQPSGRTVLIVHAGKHGKYIGGIDAGLNKHGEVADMWPRIFLLRTNHPSDAGVDKLVAEYERRLDGSRSEVVGHTQVRLTGSPLHCFKTECALGILVAEAVLWVARQRASSQRRPVQMALVSVGTFSNGDIPAGNITLGHVLDMMPHQDLLTIVRVSGQTLWNTVEHHCLSLFNTAGFLHMAGSQMLANFRDDSGLGTHLLSLSVHCPACGKDEFVSVNFTAQYDVVMPVHVANVMEDVILRDTAEILDVDVMLRFFKGTPWVNPKVDDRMIFTNAPSGVGRRRVDMVLLVVLMCASVVVR